MKAVAGYMSQTDAVISMMEQGFSQKDMAARIGISKKQVQMVVHRLNRRKMTPGENAVDALAAVLSRSVIEALAPHAFARGIDTRDLIVRIVATVALENLVDSVLDDQEIGQ